MRVAAVDLAATADVVVVDDADVVDVDDVDDVGEVDGGDDGDDDDDDARLHLEME